MPAEGEGISASTLSVEISNSGSSRSTLSPGFLSHLVMVPSKMLSPIWGITISTAMFFLLFLQILIPRQFFCGGENFFRVRQKIVFERRRVGYRGVQRGHAQHGPVQIAERLFAQKRGDFPRDSAGLGVFVDYQAFIGFPYRIHNRLFFKRQKRP